MRAMHRRLLACATLLPYSIYAVMQAKAADAAPEALASYRRREATELCHCSPRVPPISC